MAALPKFHSRTGSLVTLSNDGRTAQRSHPTQEFNNGVVLSAESLKDDNVFEVKIDKKVNSWSGSIEIGVTTCDPNNLNFPISATGFREGTWVMSGSSILKDGHSVIEEYGADLDQLSEGDKVGVMRTSHGHLHFFVNGADQGVAAVDIGSVVYAVVDLYGKCAQVSIIESVSNVSQENQQNAVSVTNDVASQLANEFLTQLSNQIVNDLTRGAEALSVSEESALHSNERLTFHERCGSLVKLSKSHRTAERRRPLDEFNNGVVMTNRPLKNDEMFEIRLDILVDKWSGSIEVGITTHNPSTLDFPATMTNMRSGTIMMSGCGILTNGKGTRREYGQYNLDELEQGDRIGLMRKSNGHLHYYINGQDQGVASTEPPVTIWGVVDLYGMAVKVTILDRNDPNYPNSLPVAAPRNTNIFRQYPDMYDDEQEAEEEGCVEKLLFHPHCGSHAAVISGQKTAHRPNALDDFNNGVVLTSRHLRPEELFEVRIDRMIDKWAGSIEIGVTLHSPHDLDFPSTMTNIRSGTWMMTGNGVMHNGTTIIDEYGQNLDRLKTGDRVGVRRKTDGTLHFYVNGIDQGQAASNVPEFVYGVIDLYGQAAQATVVDHSESLCSPDADSSCALETEELKFHSMHGQNAIVLNNGRTAARPNATGEFNDAIIMSNRPLKDNELFEVIIEKMVDRWSGSIEAGVTLIKAEDLDFPNTMTDIEYDTWILSGSAIMQDGSTIRNGYPLDLDIMSVGCRIGMMRCCDGTLHYYFNGMDKGVACSDVPPGVSAVIDLYGQCAQVSITSGSGILPTDNNVLHTDMLQSVTSPINTDVTHRFSQCCGKNITIKNNGAMACRARNFQHGLIFSSDPLRRDELFEIKVEQLSKVWSGSLHIGLTTLAISDTTPISSIPSSALALTTKLTWIVTSSEVRKSGIVIKENYAPSLERLEVGDKVGVKRCRDGTMHILLNGEDLGVAASNIQKNVFAVIDLFGVVETVSVTSSASTDNLMLLSQQSQSIVSDLTDNNETERDQDQDTNTSCCFEFHCNHGKNVLLSNNNLTARRTASYNQGVLVSSRPLQRNKLFQVQLNSLNSKWSASLMIGILGFSPERFNFPVSAICIKKSCMIIQGDSVYNCGCKVKEHYGPNIDRLQSGHCVGVLVDDEACLHLYVNGVDQGVAARDVPNPCHALIDLYGQCQEITVVTEDTSVSSPVSTVDEREKADIDDVVKEKLHRVSSDVNVTRNCEYQNICARIKSELGLPENYFDVQSNVCFCETCHKIRREEVYHKRGDPPREYALPYGWCRFSIRLLNKANALNIAEKWHVGYYGARMEAVRRILDSGDLHAVGEVATGGSILLPQPVPVTEKSSPDGCGLKQIFLSPTIRYAGCNEFSPKYRMVDPKTRKTYHVRVAFQVWLKPGSYKVGPQSLGVNEQIDPKISNNELEWSTKERGSIMLDGLLVKIE
ncbi:neuralized-like protein 4 [Pecten maximus]|uniref:neuralized-like protein 4 n=1 Tax=Pecten maximus TaxID=6579 RepID=UPI001458630E|nr:neuralized-like protein 4 [Pecten maximus]